MINARQIIYKWWNIFNEKEGEKFQSLGIKMEKSLLGTDEEAKNLSSKSL